MLEQIKASAGSGKTYTLTRRFLAHLRGASADAASPACAAGGDFSSEGRSAYSLAGILAATFTNKAAAEMQARVIRELKLRALAGKSPAGDTPPDPDFPLSPEQAKRWVEILLRRYDSLNIRTIDSLLTLLVRLNALSLSLPPDFRLAFSLDEPLEPLFDALLDRAAAGDAEVEKPLRAACKSLLRHGRVTGFMAGKPLRERLREVMQLALAGTVLPAPEVEPRAYAVMADLYRGLTESAGTLRDIALKNRLAVRSDAAAFLDHCADCAMPEIPKHSTYAAKTSFADWLKKESKDNVPADAESAFNDLASAHASLTELGPLLLAALETLPFVRLAEPLLCEMEELQRTEGIVPASRLPLLALRAIGGEGGVSDAFCRMGDNLLHLLIDEFQDTSTDQWNSILPLAENCLAQSGSLIYVGDVKQAIYGWRGGNAELFDAVAADRRLTRMLRNGPSRDKLPCNWRSAPSIVRFNNAVFGPLGNPEQAAKTLAAMLPADTPAPVAQKAGTVLAAAFAGSEQDLPQKNAARPGRVRLTRISAPAAPELAEAVREELRLLLTGDLAGRPFRDIAILVRKNKEATAISGWLSEWGIPSVTEHSFRLGGHPLVARLVDALAFLEYPLDDMAFWSCVSGPELFGPFLAAQGLGSPDLVDWLAAARAEKSGPPLFMLFRRDFPALWSATLAPFLDQAGLMSAYDTVLELIRHFRPLEFSPDQAPFIRRFEEVALAAENAGNSSLSSFLEYWSATGIEERVPMPDSMDAVRICSMHKSKGLEFPVVIVPYHHQGQPLDAPLIPARILDMPLLIHRNKSSGDPYYEALARAALEQLNLLYVAWTRPTEELHAFVTETTRSAKTSPLAKGLGVLLEPFEFTDGVYESGTVPAAPLHIAGSRGPRPLAEPRSRPSFSASPSERPMAWLPRLKIFRNPAEDSGYSERRRGLLAHACLEALRLTGDADADAARAVRHAVRVFPLFLPDPDSVARDMTDILAWYASLPEAADWMRHGSPEQSLLDADGTLHRMDLLVDRPGSSLLAVEYKTGQPGPEHHVQVRRYLDLLRAAHPGREARGVIVYLDGRILEPVVLDEDGRELMPVTPDEEGKIA